MTNILIVFPKMEEAKAIKNILVKQGFRVVAVSNTGAQILSQMDGLNHGIVICGYKLTDMLYSQLKEYLPNGFSMLLMASQQVISQCYDRDIMTLCMPLKVQELVLTVRMMVDNVAYINRKKKLVTRKNEDKEIIQEAKISLMTSRKWLEEEAYRYLQKTSMDTGNSMVEVAQMVLAIKKSKK